MVIEAFEPITWMKKLDDRVGPLNGGGWRARWHVRMAKVFESQLLLVGEDEGEVRAFSSGTVDELAAMGLVDLLAVDGRHQGKGYGRAMLRGMMDRFRAMGCLYVNLECLTTNEAGNKLYESEGFVEVARQIRWFRKL